MASPKTAYLSTTLSAQLKSALTQFCRKRGLKINHFIQEAILERLEDEDDLAVYEKRRHEKRISLEELLKTIP